MRRRRYPLQIKTKNNRFSGTESIEMAHNSLENLEFPGLFVLDKYFRKPFMVNDLRRFGWNRFALKTAGFLNRRPRVRTTPGALEKDWRKPMTDVMLLR